MKFTPSGGVALRATPSGGVALRATPSDGVNFIPYMKLLGVE
jgi:hypothetical protein